MEKPIIIKVYLDISSNILECYEDDYFVVGGFTTTPMYCHKIKEDLKKELIKRNIYKGKSTTLHPNDLSKKHKLQRFFSKRSNHK